MLGQPAIEIPLGGGSGGEEQRLSYVKEDGFPSVFYQTMIINGRQDSRTRVPFDIALSKEDYERVHRDRRLPKGGFRELREIIHGKPLLPALIISCHPDAFFSGEIRYFDGQPIEVCKKGRRVPFWLDPATLEYELLENEMALRVHVHRKHLPVTRSFANFSFIFIFMFPTGVILRTPSFEVISKENDKPPKAPKPLYKADGTKRRIRKKRCVEPPSPAFQERSHMISEVLAATDADVPRKRIRVEMLSASSKVEDTPLVHVHMDSKEEETPGDQLVDDMSESDATHPSAVDGLILNIPQEDKSELLMDVPSPLPFFSRGRSDSFDSGFFHLRPLSPVPSPMPYDMSLY